MQTPSMDPDIKYITERLDLPEGRICLEDIMGPLGREGHHIHIRYDPARKKNNFTVIFDNFRVADTDNPVLELCSAIRRFDERWNALNVKGR